MSSASNILATIGYYGIYIQLRGPEPFLKSSAGYGNLSTAENRKCRR